MAQHNPGSRAFLLIVLGGIVIGFLIAAYLLGGDDSETGAKIDAMEPPATEAPAPGAPPAEMPAPGAGMSDENTPPDEMPLDDGMTDDMTPPDEMLDDAMPDEAPDAITPDQNPEQAVPENPPPAPNP